MTRRILITGASIAGNTAAWWLGRSGFDVTVVERAPTFRDGGQNVDIRGVGREVLRRMDLEQAALDAGTGETGTAWVDAQGRIVAKVVAPPGEDGPTAEMEILRGDLAKLIHAPAQEHATFRFDDWITAIDDGADGVRVTFHSGSIEQFDHVLIAEIGRASCRERVYTSV